MTKGFFKAMFAVITVLIMLLALVSCVGGEDIGDKIIPKATVTYNLNGGIMTEEFEESFKVSFGTRLELTDIVPIKEGHTFIGWYNGEAPAENGKYLTEDITINAKWQINKVTVTFVDHLGNTLDVQEIDWGTFATAPKVEDKVDDVPFKEWSISLDSIKGDITVRPIYAFPTYTVNFETKGGTKTEPLEVRFEKIPPRPEDPEKTGYTFISWYLDKDCTEEYVFDRAFDADTLFYAKFVDDYIKISTAEGLKAISDNIEGKYLLTADINLIDENWTPIEDFKGILDGDGHKIFNFAMSGNPSLMGFFNNNNGTVKNIRFENFTLLYNRDCSDGAEACSGVIAAKNYGTIKNCQIKNGMVQMVASVSGGNRSVAAYFGGFVGINNGSIVSCSSDVDVTFSTSVKSGGGWSAGKIYTRIYARLGGIAGKNYGIIEKTSANGTITSTSTGTNNRDDYSYPYNYIYLGGIAGKNYEATARISECTSNVDIKTTFGGMETTNYVDIGAIAGLNTGSLSIDNCVANGSIVVTNSEKNLSGSIGGVVGNNATNCTVINVFSNVDINVGNTIVASVGGIIGFNNTNAVLKKSVFIGDIKAGTNSTAYGLLAGGQSGTVYLCYYNEDSVLTAGGEGTVCGESLALDVIRSDDFIYNTLTWDPERWLLVEGGNPIVK